jgi:hypothetical protein
MGTYTISTECGIIRGIKADSAEDAKRQYAASEPYDFDCYAEYHGSWYFVEEDGVRIEDHTECMP